MDPNDNSTPSNVPTSTPEATGFNPDEISAANPEMVTTGPVAPAEPVAPVEPITPAEPVAPVTPAEPVIAAPVEPAVPVAPVEPVAPTEPVAPVTPAVPVAPVEPVAPVTPAEPTTGPMVNPAAAMAPPVFQPAEGFSATEPITRPDPVPVMSPEEKELAAPITAAGPVPGSIGSAISMPSGTAPQNMTFNDPAAEAGAMQNTSMNATAMPTKAKSSKVMLFGKEVDKKLLILCGALAGILIIALVVILIIQLNG